MKKVLVFLVLFIFPVVSLAESDLSSMSTEELIVLQTSIINELMQRNEVKSVDVPQGEYIVGIDIPAGNYTVSTTSYSSLMVNEFEDYYSITPDQKIGKLVLVDGDTINIGGSCIFETYIGLGF